jgi:LCP family protein required for cell wall assembly
MLASIQGFLQRKSFIPVHVSLYSAPMSVFARSLTILGIVAGILIGGAAAVGYNPALRTTGVRTVMSFAGVSLAQDADGFTNVLLLGVGDEHHDGSDLTDTMIIASIDTKTRSAVLLSLPRDLLVDSQNQTVGGRINAIYANEKRRLQYREKMTEVQAAAQALETLGQQIGEKTGVEIHGVLKADFTAFTETVDALGGVDIDVPEAVTDYTYPVAEDQVGLFHVDAGLQHFDGETALKYARSRHSTSDFDRSARQQLLLSALAAKAKNMSMTQRLHVASDIYNRLQDHVASTLTSGQLALLAQIGSTVQRDRIITMQLNFSVGGDGTEAAAGGFVMPAPPEFYEGASVLLPFPTPGKLSGDWTQIRTFTALLLRHREVYLAHPTLLIRDAGVSSPHAWRLRNEFLRYGWNVLPIEDVSTGTGSTEYAAVYYRDAASEPAGEFAGHLLSLPVARVTDGKTGSGDVILLLGSDYRFTPFVTLSGSVLPERN